MGHVEHLSVHIRSDRSTSLRLWNRLRAQDPRHQTRGSPRTFHGGSTQCCMRFSEHRLPHPGLRSPLFGQRIQELVGYCRSHWRRVQGAATLKEFLADPEKFAAAAAAAAPVASEAPAAAAAAAAPAKEESEEEDDDMGFGLFD